MADICSLFLTTRFHSFSQMSTLKQTVQACSRKFHHFTAQSGGIHLRAYQQQAAQAVLNSIKNRLGLSIVIVFSRQSGKDELSANLKAYLLARYVDRDASIVEVNPTYKPQTINAINRLEDRLMGNLITRLHWRKRYDFMRLLGKAKVTFLSGEGTASVVGATASLLLIVNEAQDIEPATYDKKFAPMAASTNATRVFLGTSWTSRTLLAREMRAALDAEQKDGIRRVFVYDADEVRKIVPAYGQFVDGEIAKLGRQHPLVRTQYFCEEIDAQTGMFNAARRALMAGDIHPSLWLPHHSGERRGEGLIVNRDLPGKSPEFQNSIAFLIDVAGQDEALFNADKALVDGLGNPGRDSTTLSMVDIDLSTLEILQAPTYRVFGRYSWVGQSHLAIFGKFKALAETWNPLHIVIDATGVGEGLWALLDKAFPTRVIPVKFTQQEKSEIGWRFLAIIETGRFRDCHSNGSLQIDHAVNQESPLGFVDPDMVRLQYANCHSEILPGPAKTLRWGVPDGTRGPNSELIHDDFILADSLVAVLDRLKWAITLPGSISHPPDPLEAMTKAAPSSSFNHLQRPAVQPSYDPLEDMSYFR